MKANRENFLYDITNIQGSTCNTLSMVKDSSIIDIKTWVSVVSINPMFFLVNVIQKKIHTTLSPEKQRRFVSCHSLFNSPMVMSMRVDSSQLLDEGGKIYTAPKKRGTLILFDAKTSHRVRKVRNGTRKSIVGWIVGPRWK